MGAALQRTVGLDQPRDEQRVDALGTRGERGQPGVAQLAVGVEQDGHVVARPRHARVAGGPEAGVAVEHDHLGAGRRASAGPSSREPESTATTLGVGGQVVADRAQQRPQLGRRVVQDGDDREAHARRLGEQRVQRAGRALPGVDGRALARGGAQARAQRVVAGDAQQRIGQRAGVAAGDAQRGVAQRLGEARQVADHGGRAVGGRLQRREPEALQVRGATTASAPA